MTLYFVVRTDVSKDDGAQRVFGAHESLAEAEAQIAFLKSRAVGKFKVYKGSPA